MKKDRINYKRPSSQLGGKDIQKKIAIGKEENTFPGYSTYPNRDDIYNKDKEEDLNPEETSRIKKPYKRPGKKKEKNIMEDATGSDLDVPGSESDEMEENEGSEDEENNYYSLGGDDHNDLDEDKGD
ncbi:MAG: hypothetical protein WCA84_04415 [Ignavibacteriaceae bacterium]|jgi:hypothetical protein